MPERSRKRPTDVNELAKQLVDEATGDVPPPRWHAMAAVAPRARMLYVFGGAGLGEDGFDLIRHCVGHFEESSQIGSDIE